MRNTDLDVFRALIRAEAGMASSLDRAVPNSPCRGSFRPAGSAATSIPPLWTQAQVRSEAGAIAADASADPRPGTEAKDWSPDDVIHRLVELMMEMRSLAVVPTIDDTPASVARLAAGQSSPD